jgi:peroxiredoxin
MQQRVKWSLITGVVIVLFCGGFVYFYNLFTTRSMAARSIFSTSALGSPLPPVRLLGASGTELSLPDLKNGKAVLVFVTPECGYCMKEGQFLSTMMALRKDIRFYGVIPFGADSSVLKSSEGKFPFEVYFDEAGALRKALGIRGVPIKLYVENGIVKKGWSGATENNGQATEFKKWLESL